MPLGVPDYSAFTFKYPNGFLFREVEDAFLPAVRDSLLPYETVVEYLNSTVTNGTIPAITDEGSSEQSNIKGVKRSYKGSIPFNELVDKSFTITMSMKNSYMNWAIMVAQLSKYMDSEEPFLPDMVLQLLDDYDHSIIEMVFYEIQMRSISEISVNTTEQGIITRTFDVGFVFNRWGIQTLFDRKMNQR